MIYIMNDKLNKRLRYMDTLFILLLIFGSIAVALYAATLFTDMSMWYPFAFTVAESIMLILMIIELISVGKRV